MYKPFIKIAAYLGALAVALGAFGAHGLKKVVSENAVGIFETGVKYQFYHVFALLLTGILYKEYSHKFLLWSGKLFIAGIILFSGSLYILTYKEALSLPGLKFIGPITPIGGALFIAGWIFLGMGVTAKNKHLTF